MLSALRRKGFTQSEIARELVFNQSSISRELSRNKVKNINYHAGNATRMYHKRKKKANQYLKRIENDDWLRKYIKEKIKDYWSPEQIAGRVRKDYGIVVCHETIYKYIYNIKPEWKKYLRQKKGRYRRRYGRKKTVKQREEAKKRRIDIRPKIIEKRVRLGDWEGDTIIGGEKTQRILTHVDRKSGYLLADKLDLVTAEIVQKVTVKRFRSIPQSKRHTITYDNGSEFADHELIERFAKATVYFAYPYHSWERGTNENTNGLLRQFFPKKSCFKDITQTKLKRITKLINHRPRKRLGYLTPYEVFFKNMHLL
jgi:IS30 family transposase